MAVSPTTWPDVTISATIGEVVTEATPTPTPTPAVGVPTATPAPKKYIGKPLIIYGYGPKNSDVSLTGIGVSEKTTANESGYFVFERVYSYSVVYPELCIQATDFSKRVTQPSCIPPLPQSGIVPSEVGPVMLSPTISIDENNIVQGESVRADGMTVPNSNLEIYIAKKDAGSLSLIQSAYAYNLPKYNIKSDIDGNYEFSLPTQDSASYKIFAANTFGGVMSAKSNTLTFSVLTPVQNAWQEIKKQLFSDPLAWVILIEVIVIALLIIAILKQPRKAYKRKKKITSKKSKQEKYQEVGLKNRYIEFLKSKGLIS